MKTWSTLIFAGCMLAVILSVNSYPAEDVTTAKSTSTSGYGPAVPPVSSSSAGSSTNVKSTPLTGVLKDSQESVEKTSTTAKTLFRRQASDDESDESTPTDESDDDDDESDDDSDERRKRDTISTTPKGGKSDSSSESKSSEEVKTTKVPAKNPSTTPKAQF